MRYFGGKTYNYKILKKYFPNINWNKTLFVDLFGGGGNFILQKVKDYPMGINWYNDKYFPIYNVFIQLRDNYNTVIKKIKLSIWHRKVFEYARDFINNENNWDNHLDLAVNFLILLYYSFSSNFRNFSNFTTKKEHLNLINVIEETSNNINKILFYNKDYKDILKYIKNKYIKNYDYINENWNIFIYLDPPYYKHEKDYKTKVFNHEELKQELEDIKNIERLYLMLSYNNEEYIKKLYKDWNIIIEDFFYSASLQNGYKEELIIMNYINKDKQIKIF